MWIYLWKKLKFIKNENRFLKNRWNLYSKVSSRSFSEVKKIINLCQTDLCSFWKDSYSLCFTDIQTSLKQQVTSFMNILFSSILTPLPSIFSNFISKLIHRSNQLCSFILDKTSLKDFKESLFLSAIFSGFAPPKHPTKSNNSQIKKNHKNVESIMDFGTCTDPSHRCTIE